MATQGVPTWSTTAASNGSADPAVNWAEGMAPAAVNNSARAEMASVAKWRDDLSGITSGLTTGGTSTAFTVTTNATYATAAAMSGAILTIIPNATSGASPTLAVDGLTARALNVSTGVAVPTGALISGTPYMVRYVHASTEFIVLNPSKRPLTASDIIGGTSFTDLALTDTLPAYDVSATANKRILVSDALKIVNVLTADASPDSAADYVMTYDASATAAKKVLLANLPVVLGRGYIDGCILSNGTDATNDINISAGVCRDSTNAVNITIASSVKQLDANWAAGTTGGGRNSGAGIANTTYHVYAVATAAGVSGIYFHTSTTVATVITALQAETGGTDYVYARLIGSIVRAGGTILGFVQSGDEFLLKTAVMDITDSTDQTTAQTGTLSSCPTGVVLDAIIGVGVSRTSVAGDGIYVSALSQTDSAPSDSAAPGYSVTAISGTATYTWGNMQVRTNTSAQIRYRTSHASVLTKIATRGWVHPRGQNG